MKSYREIARILHISHEQVRKIETRALRKLAQSAEMKAILEEYKTLDLRDNFYEELERYS